MDDIEFYETKQREEEYIMKDCCKNFREELNDLTFQLKWASRTISELQMEVFNMNSKHGCYSEDFKHYKEMHCSLYKKVESLILSLYEAEKDKVEILRDAFSELPKIIKEEKC